MIYFFLPSNEHFFLTSVMLLAVVMRSLMQLKLGNEVFVTLGAFSKEIIIQEMSTSSGRQRVRQVRRLVFCLLVTLYDFRELMH